MDEIDAIGGRRFSQGTSADREIQRTLMELLNQLDGFDDLGQVKMVMATNRPDTLDPALLRPGRLDRKIEIPLPNESNRLEILKIHAASIARHGDIDYEAVCKLADGFNGADLRNVSRNTHVRRGFSPLCAAMVAVPPLSCCAPSCVSSVLRCARRLECLPFVWSVRM
jgi:ATP-dependent 26S proteasome regulatory subunit